MFNEIGSCTASAVIVCVLSVMKAAKKEKKYLKNKNIFSYIYVLEICFCLFVCERQKVHLIRFRTVPFTGFIGFIYSV